MDLKQKFSSVPSVIVNVAIVTVLFSYNLSIPLYETYIFAGTVLVANFV